MCGVICVQVKARVSRDQDVDLRRQWIAGINNEY